MLQRDEMVMVMIMVLVVEMMMMIPMKSSLMAVTMAILSPSGREFPPGRFTVCRRAFLSSWFSAPQRRRNISLAVPLNLGFPWGRYAQKGSVRGGPGQPDTTQARPDWGPDVFPKFF